MIRIPKTTAAALLALSLVLGIFLGLLADRWYVNHNFHKLAHARFSKKMEESSLGRFFKPPRRHRKDKHPRMIKDKLMRKLTKQLNLRNEQIKKIDAVLENQRQEVEKNREKFFSELKKTIDQTYSGILKHLDEDQRTVFKDIIDRYTHPVREERP